MRIRPWKRGTPIFKKFPTHYFLLGCVLIAEYLYLQLKFLAQRGLWTSGFYWLVRPAQLPTHSSLGHERWVMVIIFGAFDSRGLFALNIILGKSYEKLYPNVRPSDYKKIFFSL